MITLWSECLQTENPINVYIMLSCKSLHSLVPVSSVFNMWDVHEKWWRWKNSGRRKEVSGGGHSSERKGRLPSITYVKAALRGGDVEIMPSSQRDVRNDQGERLLERQMPSFRKEKEQKCVLRHPFGAWTNFFLDFSIKWSFVFPLLFQMVHVFCFVLFFSHFHIEILPDTEH